MGDMRRLAIELPVLFLLLGLAPASIAAAQSASAAEGRPDPIFLDRTDGDLAALLAGAGSAASRGDWRDAALRYQALLEHAATDARDRLIETPRRGAGDEPILVGLAVGLRARLAALPPEGLEAYRAAFDARAGALFEEAIAASDERALEAHLARYLFTSAGERAATFLGDLYLERGEALGAYATYRLVASIGRAPARRVAERLAAAEGALRAERRARLLERRVASPGPALLDARFREVAIARPDDPDGPAGEVGAQPLPVPGGVAVVRPGRVAIVPLAAPGKKKETRVISVPPGGVCYGPGARNIARYGASRAGPILCAAIEHARSLDGDMGPLPGGGEAAGARAWAARLSLDRRSGTGEMALDLFAFDLARGARLLWTTAEAGPFGEDAEWLAGVDWVAIPEVAAGAVFGAARARGGDPEVYAAAFDAAAPGRLRWRRFLCSRAFVAQEIRDEMPLVEPALALAGATLVVDTGMGVLAGIEAFRGDILWATRVRPVAPERAPIDRPAGAEVQLGDFDAAVEAPVVAETADGDLAVFSGPMGELFAVDAGSGAVRWRTAAERALKPLGVLAGRLVAAGVAEVVLIDPRTGKRSADGLPLPGPVAGHAALFDAPEGTTLPALVLLPLRGALLAVSVEAREGGRLSLLGTIPQDGAARADLAAVPGGAVFAARDEVTFVEGGRAAEPSSPARRAVALVQLYAPALPPSDIEAALAELERLRAAARGGRRPSLKGSEGEPFSLEWSADAGAVARARLEDGATRARLAIAIDAAGALRVEVAPEH
jgi:hypothetical protein